MKTALRALLIEDSQNDAEFLIRELKKEYEVQFHCVDSIEGLKEALSSKTWDITLSDFNMPGFDAFDALGIVKKNISDLPFIIVSGVIGEEAAVEAMHRGAQDYLMKDNLARLNAAVARELKETEVRRLLRAAETAHQNSEDRFWVLLNGITDYAIIILDSEGRIDSWNPGAQKIFGHRAEEIMGAHYSCLYGGEVTRAQEDLIKAQERSRFENEGCCFHKDGSLFWANYVLASLPKRYGSKTGFSMVIRDSTSHKQTEMHLKKAAETATEMSRLKSDFLNNVNHEVMTPINGMVGLLDVLSDTTLNQDQRSALTTLKSLTENLHGIVSKMLDFSKLETRDLSPKIMSFEIRKVLNEAIGVFASAAQKKNIRLHIDVSPHIPQNLMGDRDQLSLVLKNMIENAIKFTERGEVSVSITIDKSALPTTKGKIPVRFSVQDTGIGILEESRASIFSIFSQVDTSSTRKLGGTGLGLSICKRIVDNLGGKINFKSILGKGTEFWFTLNLDDATLIREHKDLLPLEVKEIKTQDVQILVIDDDLINLFVAEKLLKKLKYQVKTASGGAGALDLLKENSFDLIFMDCQMPNLDGYQTTAAIRQLENSGHRKRTPIIAWTAHSEEHARLKCLEAGMDDYAPKPIRTETFASIIDKWIKAAI